ncbi:MAG TPA: AraC family transcriptional regulator [Bryobacteraceae bacterium]|jgi:AraC family transcriptional regulator|nr:AraC family transcriptional regulator [Bryobacteraceae bacterium]
MLSEVQGALKIYRQTGESPWNGFGLSKYELPPLEIADHWFPEHVVAVDLCSTPFKRFWYENGHERQQVIQDGFVSVQYTGELRRFRWDAPVNTVIVRINPDAMRYILREQLHGRDLQLFGQIGRDDPTLRELVLHLHAELQAGCPGGSLYGDALCTKLCMTLVQKHSIETIRLAEYKGGLPQRQRRQLMDYIESSLSDNLNIDTLTQVANLSRYHLGKMFKQSTGVSLHQYVTWRRIRRAQDLLRNKHHSLSDIAAQTGFANQSHFSTMFSRTMGITPYRYRLSVL